MCVILLKEMSFTNIMGVRNSDRLEFDLKFGNYNERKMRPFIEKFLDVKCQKFNKNGVEDKFSVLDFVSVDKKYQFEVKSRRNDSKKYPTQLIGFNKYKEALKQISKGVDVWFFFHLEDKKLAYQVNFLDKLKVRMLGNFVGGEDAEPLCVIPNSLMVEI